MIRLYFAVGVLAVLGILAWRAYDHVWDQGYAAGMAKQVELGKMQRDIEKAITEGVSHEYQTKLAALERQLAAYKRVQPHCVVPVPKPAPGRNGRPAERKLSGSDGISTEWLLDFAGRAEGTRLKLLACQDFVRKSAR